MKTMFKQLIHQTDTTIISDQKYNIHSSFHSIFNRARVNNIHGKYLVFLSILQYLVGPIEFKFKTKLPAFKWFYDSNWYTLECFLTGSPICPGAPGMPVSPISKINRVSILCKSKLAFTFTFWTRRTITTSPSSRTPKTLRNHK